MSLIFFRKDDFLSLRLKSLHNNFSLLLLFLKPKTIRPAINFGLLYKEQKLEVELLCGGSQGGKSARDLEQID